MWARFGITTAGFSGAFRGTMTSIGVEAHVESGLSGTPNIWRGRANVTWQRAPGSGQRAKDGGSGGSETEEDKQITRPMRCDGWERAWRARGVSRAHSRPVVSSEPARQQAAGRVMHGWRLTREGRRRRTTWVPDHCSCSWVAGAGAGGQPDKTRQPTALAWHLRISRIWSQSRVQPTVSVSPCGCGFRFFFGHPMHMHSFVFLPCRCTHPFHSKHILLRFREYVPPPFPCSSSASNAMCWRRTGVTSGTAHVAFGVAWSYPYCTEYSVH
jgi:hypothetical protein